jgi:hypothetical protein
MRQIENLIDLQNLKRANMNFLPDKQNNEHGNQFNQNYREDLVQNMGKFAVNGLAMSKLQDLNQ